MNSLSKIALFTLLSGAVFAAQAAAPHAGMAMHEQHAAAQAQSEPDYASIIEQSAISHAWLRGEKALSAITVNYTPCGHCRQFMNELNSGLQLRINLPGRAPHTLADYLPDAFGPKDLEIKTLLMDEQDHGFALSGDDLSQAAIRAANKSHTPYSKSPSGVALQCRDGRIFSGSYAENAAFNPTLPPLQGALNLLSLNGYDYPDIQRAILAERADAPLIQWDATAATLKALGCTTIDRVLLA